MITDFFLKLATIAWIGLVVFWLLYGLLLFHPELPNKLVRTFRKKIVYEKYSMGAISVTAVQQNLIKKNQNLLSDHGVPINKIRFVFHPQFNYDVDRNVIDPNYYAFFPINDDNGLFVKDEPVIEVGRPNNLITVVVGNYKTDDNYAYLKETLKRCKIGIAIMINDEIINGIQGEPIPYKFSVDDEIIRFAVLDDAVEHYKNSQV
jgi:hypothetical protein